MQGVMISGSFDDIRLPQLRFLYAASQLGPVDIILWPDSMHEKIYGRPPLLKAAEREYFLSSLRWVRKAVAAPQDYNPDEPPSILAENPGSWFMDPEDLNEAKRSYCSRTGIRPAVSGLLPESLPENIRCADTPADAPSALKKVVVTGCYDFFHTGHIRFFEEVSGYGSLNVVIGSDRNVALLKGEGHPMYRETERLFCVGSVRFVDKAFISTGSGWMDAEPEIKKINPDIYAVNEDGDKPEKRAFCEANGISYLVLKRTPKEGLPARTSTGLRGF